ncbi:MAG: nitrilase-related carbon-nitrogen hydrolase [Bacillota bacterium]|nr:nitrilase-related carbon-nitrogen hydrolase [Bacillota bacterium]
MKLVNRLKEGLLLKLLLWHTRKARIDKALARLVTEAGQLGCSNRRDFGPQKMDKVTVAAVQGKLELVSSVEQYVERMFRYTEKAARKGAQLVVFPEDNGTHLLGLLPGMDKLGSDKGMDEALKEMAGGEAKVADIFGFLGPVTNQVYHYTFSRLAQLFQVYIMPGSIIIPDEGGQVVNRAFLYDHQGRQVGSQTKLHLLPVEHTWGISCGQELKVFDTPLGKLAFPVCMDASFYETFRLLTLMGADIILLPIANPEEYNYYKALRGIWPRVQENLVYGVKSALVGEAFGMTLTGKAGIYAPMELTPNRDGVIAESADSTGEGVVWATLDMQALWQQRAEKRSHNPFNVELYEKYFPKAYESFQHGN